MRRNPSSRSMRPARSATTRTTIAATVRQDSRSKLVEQSHRASGCQPRRQVNGEPAQPLRRRVQARGQRFGAPMHHRGIGLVTAGAATSGLNEPPLPAGDADAFSVAHNGGIDRPRCTTAAGRCARSGGLAATGVVSTSSKSFGVQSSAVHNAARVVSFSWAGCLVSSTDTDAEDICSPAFSASSRRSCAPVQTSRWAAAIRSRQVVFMTVRLPRVQPMSRRPRGGRRLR